MKKIIIGADGFCKIYIVPDEVANRLKMYCNRFLKWLEKDGYDMHHDGKGYCYDEDDFVNYLKNYLYFDKIYLIEDIGRIDEDRGNLPEKYKSYPFFNF